MNKNKSGAARRFIVLLPLIIFSAIVPLIVYTKYVELSDFIKSRWMGFSHSPDIFAYYKMLAILACAAAALIILAVMAFRKKLKFRFPWAVGLAGAYAVFVVISAVLSDYPSVAFFGAPERHEGALVILSYLIMFVYALFILDSPRRIRTVVFSLAVSSFFISVIAVLQFFGVDIFRIPATMRLLNMVPNDKYPYEIQMIFSKYTSYATMYNPNFLAMYTAMIFPVLLGFYAARRSNGGRLATAFLIYLCLLAAIGGNSTGFYYATVVTMVLILFLSFPYIKRNITNVVMLSVIVVGLLLVTNIFTGNRIFHRLGVLNKPKTGISLTEGSEDIYINDISLEKDSVFIDTTEYDLRVRNAGGAISVESPDGGKIPVTLFDEGEEDVFPGDIYYFEDEKYRDDYVITTNDEYSVFAVKAGRRVMYFHMTEEGVRVPGPGNTLDVIHDVERNEFLYKRPSMFSGRGYIWAGALPLLRDTIFVGNGSDTFFLTYPQHDYIGKINMRGSFNVIIEKPHNIYLQAAHDSGILSLAVLLSLFLLFYIKAFAAIFKKRRSGTGLAYLIASLCGVTGYLVSGILYDSAVFTAPVFWTVFALGFVLAGPAPTETDEETQTALDAPDPGTVEEAG